MNDTGPKTEPFVPEDKKDNKGSPGHGNNEQEGYRGSRGRNRNNDQRKKKSKFKGACKAIEDNVYDVGVHGSPPDQQERPEEIC